MSNKKKFEERYKSNDMPWDNKRADFNLIKLFQKKRIAGKSLRLGVVQGRIAGGLQKMDLR